MKKANSTTEPALSEPDKDNDSRSQNAQIKSYLLSGGSLTVIDGLRLFNCLSLTQRIHNLRTAGLPIITEMIITDSGKRIAKYYLNNPER